MREGDASPAKLTLGPVLFNWQPEALRDFYFRIADEAPVDSVCLGEVVCLKREPLFAPYRAEVAERLRRAGKEVVHSTLALMMSGRDVAQVEALAADHSLYVEANDIAAAALLGGRAHAIGPFVNVYNEDTVAFLAGRGATRVCLPVELSAESLALLAQTSEVELEVQAFGRLPLALSARCYHARTRGLSKDTCRFVCGEDADGMEVETLDGTPFLVVNGTQVLSHAYGSLLAELPELLALGIRRFRLSPHDLDMVAVAELFREVLDGEREPGAAFAALEELAAGASFTNGYYHGVEGAAWRAWSGEIARLDA